MERFQKMKYLNPENGMEVCVQSKDPDTKQTRLSPRSTSNKYDCATDDKPAKLLRCEKCGIIVYGRRRLNRIPGSRKI